MGFSNGYDSGYDDGFADGVKSVQSGSSCTATGFRIATMEP